ncbi:Imidazole glycerol phosphate synthase subunit HisF [Frankliniella fusca]|uniref:Imidazole glycerol phosphate synthase subunit HisF n=1 Tax=Frankliniella fusca TaxID=407009 RepID=A0AAE1HSE5_9NEOP|nr:Imidazole glycerol phosphate synthase subunit HisF [Frankliniella fusca]
MDDTTRHNLRRMGLDSFIPLFKAQLHHEDYNGASLVSQSSMMLFTRKTKAAYKMAFQCLKDMVPNKRMPHIMSDFGKGLLGALREEFPGAHLTGCLFHLDQAMCKKASKLGLRPLLSSVTEEGKCAGKVVRMCMALPFLPAEKIAEGFTAIREYSRREAQDVLEPFLDYVDRTWLQVSMFYIIAFPLKAWDLNIFRSTNNDMESYHRTLTDTLGRPHPSAWCWLSVRAGRFACRRLPWRLTASCEYAPYPHACMGYLHKQPG